MPDLAALTEHPFDLPEGWLKALAEELPIGLYRTTPEGEILYVNKSLARMLGYRTPQALMRERAGTGYVDPVSRDRFLALIERDGVVRAFESQWRSLDGTLLWIRESARAVRDSQGRVIFIEGAVENITAERAAREALEEAHAQFRRFAERVSDVIYRYDVRRDRFEFISPAFSRLTGYSPRYLGRRPSRAVRRLLHADDLRRVYRALYAAFRRAPSGRPLEIDYRVRTRDGRLLWVQDRIEIEVGPQGELFLNGVIRDVTAARESLAALRASEERFRQVSEAAQEWIWEVNAEGLYTYSSPAAQQMIGYATEEIVGRLHFFDLFVPERREALKRQALDAFARKEPITRLVNELVHKDGRIVIVETTGTPVADGEGRLLFYRGADHDITSRVQAERTLRESEERYRELVERARLGIVIDDRDGHLVYFNRRFAQMFGYTQEELQSLTNLDLVHPDERARVEAEHARRVRGAAPSGHYSFKGIRKDGTPLWVEVDALELKERGRVIGTRSYVWDVTDRTLAEQERERLIGELKKALANVKTLSGLLPICAHCKRIRDDSGYWQRVETYIRARSDAEFTHGICPACMKELYPDYADEPAS